jgi:hypothetical protein
MSDLTGKFTALETQLTTQHGEIMDVLNTIAYALGAPPTTPSINLADVVAAISTTNDLLTDIFNTVDSINNNASLNAQRLLTLLLQTACPCDDTPLLPPPLDTLPIDLEDEAKCQRIQYFLDLFSSWVILCTVYLNDNGSISSFQVNNLLSGVMLSVGISSSELNAIPTSIRDSLTTALNTNGTPSAINASIFDVITNGTVLADMRQALYAQDNAADGSNAAKDAIDMTGGPYANIISTMFYSGWPNVMYGTEPEVDASGYDGSICAPEPTVIVTESCSDSINGVQGGSYDSGNISMVGWTHVRLGVAGGGGGIVTFYADGDSKFVLNVNSDGADNYWVGTATNVRVIVASSLTVYVHLRLCTGTYA